MFSLAVDVFATNCFEASTNLMYLAMATGKLDGMASELFKANPDLASNPKDGLIEHYRKAGIEHPESLIELTKSFYR
jgi:hypothetical protein